MTQREGVAHSPQKLSPNQVFVRQLLPVAIPVLTFLVLVLTIWGPFALCSGMYAETTFPYKSETLPTSQALFYVDSLRIHTSTFYHLSYLLGEAIGWNGSFVPFQMVYAALWWARGTLVFLILRKFLPHHTLLCLAGGCFTIVHASDRALQWVGQLNQFGFIFWMLLGFYFFLLAVEQPKRSVAILLMACACFFEYVSLWSYEAQLFLILVAPITVLLRDRAMRQRWIPCAVAWYAAPVVYIALTIERYVTTTQALYQTGVMRSDWAISKLLADLLFDMYRSLAFWNWSWPVDVSISNGKVWALGAAAVTAFVLGAVATMIAARGERDQKISLSFQAGLKLLGLGVALLALSFPVYLLLPRVLWRTQMLSGMAAAVVFVAMLSLAACMSKSRTPAVLIVVALGAVVIASGAAAAVRRGSAHATRWENQRAVMQQILSVAPAVKGPVMILLLDVPLENSAFSHEMWMDLAVRLAYPGEQVAGMYYYADHTPAHGANMKIQGDKWVWDETGAAPMLPQIPVAQTIIIRYDAGKHAAILEKFPDWMLTDQAVGLLSSGDLVGAVTSVRARNRYLFDPDCCQFIH